MKEQIDFLGASALSLAMLLELVLDQYGPTEVRLVKNTDHPLKHPFLPPGISATAIGTDDWQLKEGQILFLGVNQAKTKKAVFNSFAEQFGLRPERLSSLRHSSAVFAAGSQAGPGLVMHPLTVVSGQSRLGSMLSMNRAATIGHHTEVGDYCTLHPAANVAGQCRIGAGVTLGMGCNVIDGLTIGAGTIVGAGALVTKDLPPGVVAYGQPAKVVRLLDENPFA